MSTETTAAPRIRWEKIAGAFHGYVGTRRATAVFKVWQPREGIGTWALSSDLLTGYSTGTDPDALKAEAEHWLEEFVHSLGAIFPGALRETVKAERDAQRGMADEVDGDCPHAWRPDVSCGMARALDWVLVKLAEAGPDTGKEQKQ